MNIKLMSKITFSFPFLPPSLLFPPSFSSPLPFSSASGVFTVHLFDLIILDTSVYLLHDLLPEYIPWFYQRKTLGANEHKIKKTKQKWMFSCLTITISPCVTFCIIWIVRFSFLKTDLETEFFMNFLVTGIGSHSVFLFQMTIFTVLQGDKILGIHIS